MMTFTNPLFIDIETVASVPSFEALSSRLQVCWLKKASQLGASTREEQQRLFYERGGIFAEFGKIVVISVGYMGADKAGNQCLQVQGFSDSDERVLLEKFIKALNKFPQRGLQLCGHNGKEFDFPYLCRRMVVQRIALPNVLNTAGKKPWEVNHLDTMELWKFGDRKSYTSLELLASLLEIPSSKEGMQGSEVNEYYYEKKALAEIAKYCCRDVVATVQLYRRLNGLPLIAEADIQVKLEQEVPVAKKRVALPLLDS